MKQRIVRVGGRQQDGSARTTPPAASDSEIWRIEVVGPFALPIARERWRVAIFNEQGIIEDTFDAYSENEALALKDELMKRLLDS